MSFLIQPRNEIAASRLRDNHTVVHRAIAALEKLNLLVQMSFKLEPDWYIGRADNLGL